jgi:uncharacterized protein DUF2846
MNRLLLLFISSSLFIGCASVSKAPAEKSDAAKSFEALADRGTVYLYRTGRAVGAAGQLSVKINGQDAGGTGPGSFFKWDFKPGVYTFLSSTPESSATEQIDVKAGEVYFIRQDARLGVGNGRVTMKKVDDQKGQQEVKGCKLLVSSYIPD